MPSNRSALWSRRFSDWLASHEPNSQGEYRAYCPLHEDPETSATPSASFNFAKGTWKCHGGCPNLSIENLWKRLKQDGKAEDVVVPLKENAQPLPAETDIIVWHRALMKSDELLRVMLGERGLSKEVIREHKIGFHRGRYTIPIRDVDGVLRNVRRYLPGQADPGKKMWSISGHGSPPRLFLPWLLKNNEEVVVTEGEMDALCAQANGIDNAISHTGGSSVFLMQWAKDFANKHVFLCYDVDTAGINGANKALEVLRTTAAAVYVIRLPLTSKGADVTDYFVKRGHTRQDFLELMEGARERPAYVRDEEDNLPPPKLVSLQDTEDAALVGHPLEVPVTIVGKQSPGFIVPQRVVFNCDMSWNERCNTCKMMARNGRFDASIKPWNPILLQIIGYTDERRDKVLHEIAGAPKACPRLSKTNESTYTVEELVVAPSVEHRTESVQTPIMRSVYNVGHHDTPVNTTARIIARNLPAPQDQRGMLLAWECEPVQTNLDKFKVTQETRDALRVFQVETGQTPIDKMEDIAESLSANVTHIYGRPELHMAYDAVWHSVIDFQFNGSRIGKGWLELAVVGDTRTGKSEVAMKLSSHYQAGIVQSCEGATLAGLVGGVAQLGTNSKWMTTWGVIPMNDRRLVVLDEFGGIADKGIIEQMSSIRSSGVAQLTKIKSDQTSARTRLIWIANPIDGKSLAELHQPGISALQGLVTAPEDVARFDIAMACASSDVDSRLINSVYHDPVPHAYTSELCNLLVQWVWSRKAEDVVFANGVEKAIVERADEVGRRYVPEPPLIQVENVRTKIARLAVAVAARVYSTDRTGRRVVVRMAHVESALALLDRLYGMKSFAYMSSSRRILAARRRAMEAHKQTRQYLLLERDSVTATLLAVRNNAGFKIQDFKIFGSMDDAEAQLAIKTLTQQGMIRSISHGKIRIEPALMELLQEIEEAEEYGITR